MDALALADPLALGAAALRRLRDKQHDLEKAVTLAKRAAGKGLTLDGFVVEAAAVMDRNGDLVIGGQHEAGLVVFPGAVAPAGQPTPDAGTIEPVTVSLEIRTHVRALNDPVGADSLDRLSALRCAVLAQMGGWRPEGAHETVQFERGAYLGRFGLGANDHRTGRLVEAETGVRATKGAARIWWVDRYTLRSVLTVLGDES